MRCSMTRENWSDDLDGKLCFEKQGEQVSTKLMSHSTGLVFMISLKKWKEIRSRKAKLDQAK